MQNSKQKLEKSSEKYVDSTNIPIILNEIKPRKGFLTRCDEDGHFIVFDEDYDCYLKKYLDNEEVNEVMSLQEQAKLKVLEKLNGKVDYDYFDKLVKLPPMVLVREVSYKFY